MLFELTDEQIQRGHLSDDDFSAAAGFEVRTFSLSDFPHFEELQRYHALSLDKLFDRTDAIFVTLQEAGLISPAGSFDYEDASGVAASEYATVQSKISHLNPSNISFFQHFDLIRKWDFHKANSSNSPIWQDCSVSTGCTKTDVFPGVLNENIPVGKIFRKYAAFVLTNRGISAQQYWAAHARLPEALLTNFPSNVPHTLMSDLHERRHLQQISFVSDCIVPEFYSELDADMYARAAIRQAKNGPRMLEPYLHTRYIEMLAIGPKYWFAPTMEALEKKQEPMDFFTISRAVGEIRLRLGMQHTLGNSKQYNSRQLQASFAEWDQLPTSNNPDGLSLEETNEAMTAYDERNNLPEGENPAQLYTGLRQLVDSHAFTDAFTEKLAVRILAALNYFNPDLLFADREPNRRRMADCMRAHKRPDSHLGM